MKALLPLALPPSHREQLLNGPTNEDDPGIHKRRLQVESNLSLTIRSNGLEIYGQLEVSQVYPSTH